MDRRDVFIATMRTGRHEGKGRPVMPPMPWFVVGALNDEDIKPLFAYLQSLPPVEDRVPAPAHPPEAQRQWNENGTEATLAPVEGLLTSVEVAPGRRHVIPAAGDCLACHGAKQTGR